METCWNIIKTGGTILLVGLWVAALYGEGHLIPAVIGILVGGAIFLGIGVLVVHLIERYKRRRSARHTTA